MTTFKCTCEFDSIVEPENSSSPAGYVSVYKTGFDLIRTPQLGTELKPFDRVLLLVHLIIEKCIAVQIFRVVSAAFLCKRHYPCRTIRVPLLFFVKTRKRGPCVQSFILSISRRILNRTPWSIILCCPLTETVCRNNTLSCVVKMFFLII